MEFDKIAVKSFGDDEVRYTGYLVNAPLTPDEIDEIRIYLGSHYDGPGRSFANRASVRTTKRRTLFLQRSGLDV